MKTVCDCGSKNVEIFSVVESIAVNNKKAIKVAEITYICNSCGNMESVTKYLYEFKVKDKAKGV